MNLSEMRASSAASVSIKDISEVMGVDTRTAGGALSVNGGEIPSHRVGRRIVIPRERFLAWFDGGTSASEQVEPAAESRDVDVAAVVRAKLRELLGALEAGV